MFASGSLISLLELFFFNQFEINIPGQLVCHIHMYRLKQKNCQPLGSPQAGERPKVGCMMCSGDGSLCHARFQLQKRQ